MHTPTQQAERAALGAALDAAIAAINGARCVGEHDAAGDAQITLTPLAPTQHQWEWVPNSTACWTWSRERPHTASRIQRRHGSERSAPWFGVEGMIDQRGRLWERRFDAVIDDFGDLVEVVL